MTYEGGVHFGHWIPSYIGTVATKNGDHSMEAEGKYMDLHGIGPMNTKEARWVLVLLHEARDYHKPRGFDATMHVRQILSKETLWGPGTLDGLSERILRDPVWDE